MPLRAANGRVMGVAKTMECFIKRRIVAAKAALGLVREIAPDAELEARSMALATEIADGPQAAIRMLKRSIYNAADMTFEQSLDAIAAKTAVTDHHPDAREGGLSFREKRTPQFNAWLEAYR